MFFNCSTVACSRFVNPFRLRAFSRVFLANKFGNDLKFLYLCNVKEKRQNLRPAWTTKIACARGTCFLGKAKNGVIRRQSKNNLQ